MWSGFLFGLSRKRPRARARGQDPSLGGYPLGGIVLEVVAEWSVSSVVGESEYGAVRRSLALATVGGAFIGGVHYRVDIETTRIAKPVVDHGRWWRLRHDPGR